MKRILTIFGLVFWLVGICQIDNIVIDYSDDGYVIDYTGDGYVNNYGLSLYNDSAQALFSRFTETPSDELKAAISTFFDRIQPKNIDDTLDFLFCFALHNATDALLDWFRDESATVVNSPTFIQYQGYTTNGTDSYLKLNYNPGTDAINYKLSNNHIGVYLRTNDYGTNKWLIGCYDGSNRTAIRTSATDYLHYNNGTAIWTNSHGGDITGTTLFTRRVSATGVYRSRNGGTYTSTGLGVVDIPNQVDGFYIGCQNANGSPAGYSANEFSFVWGGGSLSQEQATTLHAAIEEFLDTFNKGVDPLTALPSLTPDMNVFALQQAIGTGDTTINLTVPGTYQFDSTIYLYDSTTLNWGSGTSMEMSEAYTPVYINEGALTGTRNHNIELNGLDLITNEYQDSDTLIWGMRGHLSFHTITDLRIKDVECIDLGTYHFFFHAANWENILIDGATIAGDKDALHFHNGHGAIIRDVYNSSFDDLIFLGSTDFPYIQPDSIGDVYDMQFINVNDLNVNGNSGYQTRVYLASWLDWTNGFTYKTGDMASNVGNIYQCANPSGFSAVAANAPTHTIGSVIGADGIRWKFKDTKSIYHADVHDITFDSCNYYKNRNYALSFENIDDGNARNIYPGSEDSAKAYNWVYTNCSIDYANQTDFLYTGAVIQDLTLENNYFDSIQDFMWTFGGIEANDSVVLYSDNNLWENVSQAFITSRTNNRKTVFISTNDSTTNTQLNTSTSNGGVLRAINYDLPFDDLLALTPAINDICRTITGQYIWDGLSWNLLT